LTVSKGCAIMIPYLQQLSTTTCDLRKFPLVVGGVFLLLSEWFLFRHKAAGPHFLIPGVVLVLFGFVAPRALEIVYIAWMSLAFTMGLLVSTVVLTLFYFNYLIGLRRIGLCLWASCQQSCSGAFFRCGKDSGSYQSYFCCFC
jgi:hypothetical protein